MFLEIILAGLVAYSAHLSAGNASTRVNDRIAAAAKGLDRSISVVEQKVDELHIKLDTNQVRLMRALTWHDYVQTLHVKGAKYKGDNLYVLREKKTVTTANLATKEVREVNGSFTLYKSFTEDTEKLYADTHLVYEKMGNGEIKVYDDYGRIYMHTNSDNETRTYRPDGKMQSIRWADGAVWYYKYDEKGNVVEVESYNMSANSRKPPPSRAVMAKWRECAQQNSVTACVKVCTMERGGEWSQQSYLMIHDDTCFNHCKARQMGKCGPKPT